MDAATSSARIASIWPTASDYAVATARHKLGMHPAEAREIVDLYSAWPVVVLDPILILAASRLHETAGGSFRDALIVEAARVAGAGRVLSVDLAHGQQFDGIRVENPCEGLRPSRLRSDDDPATTE